MGKPSGFSFTQRKNGEVLISHQGRVATILRGRQADAFLKKAEVGDGQELMARPSAASPSIFHKADVGETAELHSLRLHPRQVSEPSQVPGTDASFGTE